MAKPVLKRSNSLIEADIKAAIEKLDKIDCSTLWLQKTKTAFRMFDLEETGSMTRDTLKLLASRFKQYAELPEEEAQALQDLMNSWWDDVFKQQTSVSFEMFYKTRYVIMSDPLLQEANQEYIHKFFGKVFSFINTGHEGEISKKEWRVFFRVLGIDDTEYADQVFGQLDTTGSGSISLADYLHAGDVYINTQEPSKYDNFFGPLQNI